MNMHAATPATFTSIACAALMAMLFSSAAVAAEDVSPRKLEYDIAYMPERTAETQINQKAETGWRLHSLTAGHKCRPKENPSMLVECFLVVLERTKP